MAIDVAMWWATLLVLTLHAVLYFFGASVTRRVSLAVATGSLFIMAASSQLTGDSGAISIGLRVAGVVFILFVAYNVKASAQPRMKPLEPEPPRLFVAVGPPIVVYVAVAYFVHGSWETGLAYLLGATLLAATATAGVRLHLHSEYGRAITFSLSLALLTSFVYAILDPSSGVANLRLRGLFGNANTIGFYAFLLGTLLIVARMRVALRLTLLAAVVVALTWSASRSSFLSFGVFLIVVLGSRLRRPHFATWLIVLLPVSVAAAYALWSTFDGALANLFRTNNSRSDTITYAWDVLTVSPIVGGGVENVVARIAGTPIVAAAHAGLIGLAAMVVLYLQVLRFSRHYGSEVVALTGAAILHSVFESWFLTTTGPQLFMFVLAWYAMGQMVRQRDLAASTSCEAESVEQQSSRTRAGQ